MASWLLLLACVGATVARPQLVLDEPLVSIDNDNDLLVHELSASETADIIRDVLPKFNAAISSQQGSPMTRIENVVLSLLPIGEAAIAEKSEKYDDYDKEKYEKQQEDAEKIVPALLDTVKTLVQLFPTTPATGLNIPVGNFQPNIDLSGIPTVDSPFVPNRVIKGQTIGGTNFVPEIVIPDIVIQ